MRVLLVFEPFCVQVYFEQLPLDRWVALPQLADWQPHNHALDNSQNDCHKAGAMLFDSPLFALDTSAQLHRHLTFLVDN